MGKIKVLLVEQNATLAAKLAGELANLSFDVRVETNLQRVSAAAWEFGPDLIVIDPLVEGSYDLNLVRGAIAQRGIGFVTIYTVAREENRGALRLMAKSLGVDIFFFGQQTALLDAIQKKLK